MTYLHGLERIYGSMVPSIISMVFRRSRRRSTRMAPVIQSYKKVLNFAPISRVSGTTFSDDLSLGVDSVPAGQTGVTDPQVPTGSVIKFFEIQWALGNVSGGNNFFHVTIQKVHTGQGSVAPDVIGGSPQRNQVFFQSLFQIGTDQNGSRVYRFKVPKRFQRVRDGDSWRFVRKGSATFTEAIQVIYKFYR